MSFIRLCRLPRHALKDTCFRYASALCELLHMKRLVSASEHLATALYRRCHAGMQL